MADKNHLILTAVGPDRVGLVEKISAFIARHGCNIEDSKMAVFCGEFAVIVLISGDGASLVKIARDYREIETETYAAPVSGTPIFRLEAEIAVPITTNINAVRERFAEIQREENIDIELSSLRS